MTRSSFPPWRPLAALLLIWFGTLSGWSWIWGVLFLSWTLPAFTTGRIHLIEEVEKARHPVLFWSIAATWIVLSLALVAVDIASLWGLTHPGGIW